MENILERLLSFLFIIGLIILVHELGHFLAARAVGIRVDRFSIGFGPKIFAVLRGDTEYRVSWIPLGGYVKMAGMIDESMEDIADDFDPADPKLFINKNAWQKIFAICAGVIMNILLAVFILWGVFTFRGLIMPEPVIGLTEEDHPAIEAGLQAGDRILAIDGIDVATWTEMEELIRARPGKEIEITFERDGAEQAVALTTKRSKLAGSDEEIGMIGVGREYEYERLGIGHGFVYSWVATWSVLEQVADTLWKLVTGQISVRSLMGPVGIAKLAGDTYVESGFVALIQLLAIISINIGFLNILPFPALDGGHLVMVLVEGVRRRPLSTKLKIWIQQVGMILLLVLIAVVIFNDFRRPG